MGTDIHGWAQVRYGHEQYEKVCDIEDTRNYAVFAALANVRNGFGFAGVNTFEPLTPIAMPRGLPVDLDTLLEEGEFGDHSYSWLTLSEVLAWPGWGEKIHMIGLLDSKEYARVKAEGSLPQEWCGGASGPGVVITSHEAIINGTAPEDYTYVHYEWDVPFTMHCHVFWKWLQYLEAKYGWLLKDDPAAVRFVFGFDS